MKKSSFLPVRPLYQLFPSCGSGWLLGAHDLFKHANSQGFWSPDCPPQTKKPSGENARRPVITGAGDEIRTRDPRLGNSIMAVLGGLSSTE